MRQYWACSMAIDCKIYDERLLSKGKTEGKREKLVQHYMTQEHCKLTNEMILIEIPTETVKFQNIITLKCWQSGTLGTLS